MTRAFPIQLATADALWPNRQQGIDKNLGDRTIRPWSKYPLRSRHAYDNNVLCCQNTNRYQRNTVYGVFILCVCRCVHVLVQPLEKSFEGKCFIDQKNSCCPYAV